VSEVHPTKSLSVHGVRVAKLFIGRKFHTSACKVQNINPTPPYSNALNIVNYNIHRILVFRKAEGGET
jgi:hypothetical protein